MANVSLSIAHAMCRKQALAKECYPALPASEAYNRSVINGDHSDYSQPPVDIRTKDLF